MSMDAPEPCPEPSAAAGDKALMAEGWTPRFLADPHRADEAMEIYRGMGLEAKAVAPTPADFGPACSECAHAACTNYLMIYTRAQGTPL